MIRAMIFDLDGTLVKTERLKALSYARAAVELSLFKKGHSDGALCPRAIREADVLDTYKEVVGRPRREVALSLMERFDLEEQARARMEDLGVSTPWQAFVQVRLRYYEALLADPAVLRENQWSHTVELLHQARRVGCKVGLATMSYCPQVRRVLKVLNLTEAFDVVASRDDVEHGKPDPEIYQLVARELSVPPAKCLVIEDSPSGVKAALAAGMWCIAVTTPFTRKRIHAERLLDEHWIVDDPDRLTTVVQQMARHQNGASRADGAPSEWRL